MFYLASGISILILYRAYSESCILHLASCIFLQAHFSRQLGTSQPCISHVISHNLHFFKCTSRIFYSILLHFLFLILYFLCTYQCKSRGRGSAGKGQGFDALDYPPVGLWLCEATLGLGHLTLTDRSLVSIQKRLPNPSLEAFWKSCCWRKVWIFICFNRHNPIL